MIYRIVILSFITCLATLPAFAQDEAERIATEQRLRTLQEQIERDRSRLSETTREEEESRETLRELDREIALRAALIQTYQKRIRQIGYSSDSIRTSMDRFKENIAALKEQYRTRALHAYKYGRLHDLALILSAESINQMLIRVNYLHRFSEQRQQKLQEIENLVASLQSQQEELEMNQKRNEQMLADARDEENRLVRLKRERDRVLAALTHQRADIEKEINRKEAAAAELSARIRQLTAAAASRSNDRNAVGASSAEYVALSGSFRQNQGKLPWPAEGVVTEPFGNRVSPTLGTTTNNPGILIATLAAAEVKTVFDGEVILVDVMPEYGTVVSIAHGEYQTVYSNFSMIYVNRGDRVRAGQVIGRAGTSSEPQKEAVFFAVFRNGQAIDPVPWLIRH